MAKTFDLKDDGVVVIIGQAFGVLVYLRNLYFVLRDRGGGAATVM